MDVSLEEHTDIDSKEYLVETALVVHLQCFEVPVVGSTYPRSRQASIESLLPSRPSAMYWHRVI